MGDLRPCLPRPNGTVLREDRLCSSSSSSSLSSSSSSSSSLSSSSSSSSSPSPSPPPSPASIPDPASIAEECWVLGEQTAREIVRRIQPTLVANKKRKEIIAYVQGLMREYLGCEVFPYGSVPLKTYLPDGDIDLAAFSSPNVEEALVADVHAVLRGEVCNETAKYEVKDVNFIDAEVKLVKCLIENIVVDISFNQLGGLCTLCFLEQVDRLVGKDHLFKRSIILIKAWCYYESRILGAHHGLISTYALETLVLYIFHIFHSSLNGPLAVLYRFLDYFGKFDWDNYCISLNGPVCKSSLPDIVAEVPENLGNDLLLSQEFLRNCAFMFSVPSRGVETNSRAFPQKHFNIIDPLKENNNLGRSVNKGNFYRIRSAFKYGARKLGHILLLPRERISGELYRFFVNTLGRRGSYYLTDAQNIGLASGARISDQASLSSCSEMCSEDHLFLKPLAISFINDEMPGIEVPSGIRDEQEKYLWKAVSSPAVPESNCPTDRKSVSGHRLTGDAKGLEATNDSFDCSPLSSDLDTLESGKSFHAPCLSFSDLFRENGKIETGNHCQTMPETSVVDNVIWPANEKKHLLASNAVYSCCNHEGMTSIVPKVSSPVANVLETLSPGLTERDLVGNSEGSKVLKFLLDLSGDYDSHLKSLLNGLYYNGYTPSSPVWTSPPMSYQLQNKNPWETVQRSLQFKQNVFPQMNSNDGILGPQFYSVNPCTLSSVTLLSEEKKQRGTGTYIPNMNYRPYKDRLPSPRGRNQAPMTHGRFPKHSHNNNGLATALQDMNLIEESSIELSHAGYSVLGHGKSNSSDSHKSYHLWGSSHANGFSLSTESQLQNFSHKSGLSTTPRVMNKLEVGSHEILLAQHPVLGHGKLSSSESQKSPSSLRGSSHASGLSRSSESQLQKSSRNNGLATASKEMNLVEGSQELSQAEYPVLGHGKSRSSDSHKSHPPVWGPFPANGLSCPSERNESGSVDPQPWGAPCPGGNQLDFGISHAKSSTPGLVAQAVQSPQLVQDSKQERVVEEPYHLKDDDDFPPLSH